MVNDQQSRSSLEQLARAFHAAPNGFVLVNQAGMIVAANNAFIKMFGYPVDAILNGPFEALLPETIRQIHVDLQEQFDASRVVYAKHARGHAFTVEIRRLTPLCTPQGTLELASVVNISERLELELAFRGLFEASPYGQPILDDSGRIIIDKQLGDTTGSDLLNELRKGACQDCPVITATGVDDEANTICQREHDLQDILDHAPSLLGYWDASQRVRYGNRTHQNWFDVQQDVLPSMSVREAIGEKAYAIHHDHILKALRGIPQLFEYTLPDGDNSISRHFQAEYRPDTDESGKVLGFYVSIIDITLIRAAHTRIEELLRCMTEQKLLNQTLVNARNAAQEAARTTSALLADMSHEIRTPINAIVGLSRLALDEPLPPKANDYIERVYDSTLALMHILDDVLDYSKVEAGQMRLEQMEFDLENLLQRTADLFSAQVEQKRLHFDIAFCPIMPTHIVGDPLRLSQILNNLVSNAIKFTDQGGIWLTINIDSGLLRFSVRDTGVGIASAQLESLFVPFSQGEISVYRHFGGTGLGLAICKKMVGMMKGEIGVDSCPGQGSEFWFSVPFPVVPQASQPLPQYRLLLIGDDLESLGRRRQHLKAMNQTITVANSLEMACNCIARSADEHSAFDLVIVDWCEVNASTAHTLRTLRGQLSQHGGERVPLIHLLPGFDHQPMVDILGDKTSDVLLTHPVLPGALRRALRLMGDVAEARPSDVSSLDQLQQRGLSLHGRRVLLVEDNRLNQMVAQAFLQQAGLNVETADNGDEAVRCMESTALGYFDAILMDMHMPTMGGLEASRLIRQLPQAQNLPIIAMTAAVLPEDREQCQQAGMIDMVTKPFLAEVLVDTLLKWVRH
ncbi:MAG: response regulator [Aquabacterium sp.]|uniref:response regulator n=1 Tax=Aquabacterium sp. TaxID=1872578 RepID=UPI00271B921B|nr:response regulator [Aquabacterium sp.]MDO9002936.1 response regulator [Aquabacterium sp.]